MSLSTWQRKLHIGQADRRKDERAPCEGEVVVDILTPHPRTGLHVRILDVSPASLKLSLPFHLAPGTLVRIHMTDTVATAEVRYCTSETTEYHVGVRIEEIAPRKG